VTSSGARAAPEAASSTGRAPTETASSTPRRADAHAAAGSGPEHHEHHDHQHTAGSAGYKLDFSHTQHFAAHFDDPARDAWQKPQEVVRLLALSPGQTVADIGAGTGYFAGHLSRAVGASGRVLALDVEPKMVEHLRQRAERERWSNVVPRTVPGDDPRLERGSVDRVLIVNTWHHIDQRERYAAKLGAALAPNGRVVIVDFTLESEIGPPHAHRLAPERVLAELKAGGLKGRVVTESLPNQYVVSAGRE
jgi:SAM-dependent methyltransferase